MQKLSGWVFPAITILALGGCTTADEIQLPSGGAGYTVACDGSGNRWSSCYEKASEVCPAGYDVVTKDGDSTPVLVSSAPGMMTGGAVVRRSLMIQCKAAAAAQ